MPVSTDHLPPPTELSRLAAQRIEEQRRFGYADTLREILQQPETWRGTTNLLATSGVSELITRAQSAGPGYIVLTGSGSSILAGE